jgi:hypothetical protein
VGSVLADGETSIELGAEAGDVRRRQLDDTTHQLVGDSLIPFQTESVQHRRPRSRRPAVRYFERDRIAMTAFDKLIA